jgi:hypothetical protein
LHIEVLNERIEEFDGVDKEKDELKKEMQKEFKDTERKLKSKF